MQKFVYITHVIVFLLKQPDGEFKEFKWLDQRSIFKTLFWSAW